MAGLLVSADSEREDSVTSTLKAYFAYRNIPLDEKAPTLADKYSDDILTLMDDANNEASAYRELLLDLRINTLIYKYQMADKFEAPLTAEDEVLLKAIDLIVPDTSLVPIYGNAKRDLRKFFSEQPEICRRLLAPLEERLSAEELSTEDAAQQLRHYYNHWIPFSRLLKLEQVIKPNAQ